MYEQYQNKNKNVRNNVHIYIYRAVKVHIASLSIPFELDIQDIWHQLVTQMFTKRKVFVLI